MISRRTRLQDLVAEMLTRTSSGRRRQTMKRQDRDFTAESVEQRVMLSAADMLQFVHSEEIAPGAIIQRWTVDVANAPQPNNAPGSGSFSTAGAGLGGPGLDMDGGAPAFGDTGSNLNGNGLQFNLIPEPEMSQESIDGFTAAANLWSAIFTDDIMVNINIGFRALGPGILAQAGSTTESINYSNFRTSLIDDARSADDATAIANLPAGPNLSLYTSDPFNGTPGNAFIDNNNTANNRVLDLNTTVSKATGLRTPGNTAVDATITFSTSFSWDFDRSNGITGGQFDFVGIAAHEIGHALGFRSGADAVDATSGAAPSGNKQSLDSFRVLTSMDLFRFSADSIANGADLDLRADTAVKFFSIDGGASPVTTLFSTGVRNGDGRQASHWKDNQGIGIMDPTTAPGEFTDITDFDVRGFDVMGWDVRMDFGDAPDAAAGTGAGNYQTNLSDDGPRHSTFSASGLVNDPVGNAKVFLGTGVSSEAVALQNSTATADTDDGVVVSDLIVGETVSFSVTSTGGELNYFVDFNQDGDFTDPGESFTATVASGTQNVDIVVPATAAIGTTMARFRLSTAGGLGPLGPARDGEVEDYQVNVVNATTEVLINEVDSDTPGTDTQEFVELFGAANAPLDGLVLVFYNGSNDQSYAAFDLDGFTLSSTGYFVAGNADVPNVNLVFGPNGLQNGADAVAVYVGNATDFPNGTAVTTANLVDAVVYDTADADDAGLLVLLNSGEPQLDEAGGGNKDVHALARVPNGSGGARNTSSFVPQAPTPGATNSPPPGVVLTESGGSTDVTEGAAGDTYTVVLATAPTADVTVTVTPDGQTDLGSGAGIAVTLTFTTANWDTAQTVNVVAVDDAVIEGNHTSTITHTTSSTDGDYNGLPVGNVTVNITDNDTPAITVTQTDGTTVVTEGDVVGDTFDVVLVTVPSANVTVTITPDNQTDLGAGQGAAIVLTFTPGDALVAQTVTVVAFDDAVIEGDHTSTITFSVASSDTDYNGLSVPNLVADIKDNDAPPPLPIFINEVFFNPPGIDTGHEYIELRGTPGETIPADTYLVLIEGDSGSDPGVIDQIFTLAGMTFGSNGFLVLLQSGNSYTADAASTVVTATATGWGTTFSSRTTDIENGSTSFVLINAATAPAANQDVDANGDGILDGAAVDWLIHDAVGVLDGAAGDTAYGFVNFSPDGAGIAGGTIINLTAETGQPYTPQYVGRFGDTTGSTGPDWVAAGIIGAAPNFSLNSDASQVYPFLVTGDLDHIGATNDFSIPADVIVVESGGSTDVTEGGTGDSYTLVLSTAPTADVVITVTPNGQVDLGNGAGVAVPLTFTTANWDVPQTVNVTAIDDLAAEGAHTAPITHTVSSSDTAFNGLTVADVVVNITDNDTVGFSVIESDGATTVVEGGATDSYTVALTSIPSSDVTVTLTPDSQIDLGAGAGVAVTLIFTPANALVAQTVTVTAFDDAIVEGAHSGTITMSATSADTGYNNLTGPSVTASIADNDFPVVRLNEVLANPTSGDDAREYVELIAPDGAVSLSGMWLLVLEGDGGGAGTIDGAVDLSALTTGSNGLLLLGEGYAASNPWASTTSAATAVANGLNANVLENGTLTVLLVTGFSGTVGQDLDTDNDGVFDATPFGVVLDSVGWTDGGGADRVYSAAVLTQSSGTPDAASRFVGNTDANAVDAWFNGDLVDLGPGGGLDIVYSATNASSNLPAGATITPGDANEVTAPPELSIAADQPALAEGNAGVTSFTFTVTRAGATTGSTTVDWSVSSTQANAADFVGGSLPAGTVTFNSGDTTATITVEVQGDLNIEGDELFTVTLANASGGATFDVASADSTIQNDDNAANFESAVFYNADAAAEKNFSPDQTGQRSMVRRMEIVFDGTFSVPVGAVSGTGFVLTNTTTSSNVGLSVISATSAAGKTTVVFEFTSSIQASGSLTDGNYRLVIDYAALGIDGDADNVVGGTRTISFHRLFGDSDGDRDVDSRDSRNYRLGLRGVSQMVSLFDFDNDGSLLNGGLPDEEDRDAFFANFGKYLQP